MGGRDRGRQKHISQADHAAPGGSASPPHPMLALLTSSTDDAILHGGSGNDPAGVEGLGSGSVQATITAR